MKFDGCRTLLTGAGSGIGRCLALALAARGARLVLVGRDAARLDHVAGEISQRGGTATPLPFDLAVPDGHERLVADAVACLGGLDLLINNAGVSSFGEFVTETPAGLRHLVNTNLTAPLLLTHAVLPVMLQAGSGRIVNIGSILGSIGLPHFTAYSASKFALRGFSEALRRELADTSIGVTYIAPRTTRTAFNSDALYQLSTAEGNAIDTPESVVAIIIDTLATDRAETCIGWPEKLFVRINALLPRLVDRALGRQTQAARRMLRNGKT